MESEAAELQAENDRLRQQIARLAVENHQLELLLTTVTEHGDAIGVALQTANQQLRQEIAEHQRTEAMLRSLLQILSQQREDLEIILDTLREHGDLVDAQWQAKVSTAERLAMYDGLTQIPNRRHFDSHLQQQWRQMIRDRSPLSILLCDVDCFKQFNDRYGHMAGDECLRRVAQTMDQTVQRAGDLVARYGGEEFAVILPQTPLKGALSVARRMQRQIQQLAIPHDRSSVSARITLSIGAVCTTPEVGQSPTMLLDEADRLLYLAKQQGRNQVVHPLSTTSAVS